MLFSVLIVAVRRGALSPGAATWMFLILFACNISLAHGSVFYVDSRQADDAGDGHSWATAKKTLQAGIDAASAAGGGELWVAGGVYGESRSPADGALTLKSGVRIYGGFAGGEAAFKERDIAAHPTVIDGSTARAGNAAERTVCCSAISDSRLDGVIICGGKAQNHPGAGGIYFDGVGATVVLENCTLRNNIGGNGCGAAIGCNNASPTITSCTLIANEGSAIFSDTSTPTFRNCRIDNNHGPGMFAYGFAAITFVDCSISSNTDAGLSVDQVCQITRCRIERNLKQGICMRKALTITSSTIADNGLTGILSESDVDVLTITSSTISGNRQGGISAVAKSALTACRIIGNSGGIGALVGDYSSFRQCTISDNQLEGLKGGLTLEVYECLVARNGGTGVVFGQYKSGCVQNCSIIGNRGSGISCQNSTMVIWNCYIADNEAQRGGGLFIEYSGSYTIGHCTIVNNRAEMGGGIYCPSNFNNPSIVSTIFANNTHFAVFEGASTPWLKYCLFYQNPDGDVNDTMITYRGAAEINAKVLGSVS